MSDDSDERDHDEVPRLPRGRGLRLSRIQLVRIAGTAILFVFLVMMQRPCSTAVSTFVTGFGGAGGSGDPGGRGSAATALPRPGTVDVPASSAAGSGTAAPSLGDYEHLRPGMTDAEIKAVIERARGRAAGSGGAP